METSHNQIVSFIWSIADDVLRDVFLRGQYRDVILPMVVLRRLDALLEPTKLLVEEEIKENGIDYLDEGVLKDITGLSYFNTSKWTLNRLKSQASDNNDILYDNFNTCFRNQINAITGSPIGFLNASLTSSPFHFRYIHTFTPNCQKGIFNINVFFLSYNRNNTFHPIT